MKTDLLKVGKLYEMKMSTHGQANVPAFISIDKVKYFQQKTIVLLIEKEEYMGFEYGNYVKILLEEKSYIINSMYLEELTY